MIRYWQLPGGQTAKDEPSGPVGYNLFWYCFQCGEIYARAWVWEPHFDGNREYRESLKTWKALAGCCPKCPGNLYIIPGTMETIALLGWRDVPLPILKWQLNCEIAYTRAHGHPWNKELENA